MLLRFEVKGFKSFDEWFVLDFSKTNDYQFNTECIKDDSVNKAMIYGANGSGKSNLGFAIFDIISHLTDKNFVPAVYSNYLNASNKSDLAEFKYVFKLGGAIVEYSYGKFDVETLAYEALVIDGVEYVSLDRRTGGQPVILLEGAENLNLEIKNSKLSILKYIKNNTILTTTPTNKAFNDFNIFVDSMLLFKSSRVNSYLGLETGANHVAEYIIEQGHIKDFQVFLNTAGVECELTIIERNGEQALAFVFNDKTLYFFDAASTGTVSLTLFYCWLQRLQQDSCVSFVFIDEFDAYYHHTLAKMVVNRLKSVNTQAVLTTHNTTIMTNDLLRPDCYFLMNKEKIKPISQCTDKELRVAHNLEKMYKAGSFNAE